MFARTKRLTLRPAWPEDAAALTKAIAHESVAMKLARMPWPYGRAEAESFLALPRGAEDAHFLILSHEHVYPRLVGSMSLRDVGDAHELGYWLTPAAWDRGYATEAGRIVLEMARHALPVRRLRASHHLDNPASRRVLTKLGFREVRREAHFSLAHGRDVECAVMERDIDEGRLQVPMAA